MQCISVIVVYYSLFIALHVRLMCESCTRVFFFQAEDGIRVLVRSRGLGDVYKRQRWNGRVPGDDPVCARGCERPGGGVACTTGEHLRTCLLYTSDAADERSSVDLGGRRIIQKKKNINIENACTIQQ